MKDLVVDEKASAVVLGAGAWGTALALALLSPSHRTLRGQSGEASAQDTALPRGAADSPHAAGRPRSVTLWTHLAVHEARLLGERENAEFLPGFPLPEGLAVGSDLEACVRGRQVVVVAVPSFVLREVVARLKPHLTEQMTLVLATKGIEQKTHLLAHQVVTDIIGSDREGQVVVLSGPSFAKEVARGLPTSLVAASSDAARTRAVQHYVSNDFLRVYTSSDPIGVEVGASLKNVIAVAAGAADGLGFGHNTRAALITRGIAEMGRFASALGGKAETLAGLSGVGDLVLTCTSELSRNRMLGYHLGKGATVEEALARSQGVAEGYRTAEAAAEMAASLGVDAPILAAVDAVLHRSKSLGAALRDLLARPLSAEWE